MNRTMQTLTAAALAFTLLAPAAWAGENDHAGHEQARPDAARKMDHGQMDHGQMDHSQMQNMDHSKMQGMDHGKMDHGAMHQDQNARPKADNQDDR
ncbi:hypothetical protein [Metapseudomonas resinovorans]|uniref:Copper resistance protein B n=1 Tax=Metapseudomonas resinovorans NBRC 106553 TaxID=1245471 RepID=S6AGW0_METRE|nr:hypothetical protein [Pseudomonas resinovorans]BAN47415.1 hypothetical protein PCA10_16830 [Pseudomonas resinovorans NBRC 106553]